MKETFLQRANKLFKIAHDLSPFILAVSKANDKGDRVNTIEIKFKSMYGMHAFHEAFLSFLKKPKKEGKPKGGNNRSRNK